MPYLSDSGYRLRNWGVEEASSANSAGGHPELVFKKRTTAEYRNSFRCLGDIAIN
jgi:hypothetical protein